LINQLLAPWRKNRKALIISCQNYFGNPLGTVLLEGTHAAALLFWENPSSTPKPTPAKYGQRRLFGMIFPEISLNSSLIAQDLSPVIHFRRFFPVIALPFFEFPLSGPKK
jgi:hypothetical protein